MLILFDIDMTLITTGGSGMKAMGDAGRELFGESFATGGIDFAGRLDPLIISEMLARHDFITPTLGGLPWFEKPPLLYWLIIASFRVLGVSEYAARLGPAVCALLSAVGVFWIGEKVAHHQARLAGRSEGNNSFPVLSALVFLSSGGVIVFARGATFDIVITMTLTLALACFFVGEIASTSFSDYTVSFLPGPRWSATCLPTSRWKSKCVAE